MKTQAKNSIAISTIAESTVLTLDAVKVTEEKLDHNKTQKYTLLRLVVLV